MAIRYDKKLDKEINRTIKNFNQKVDRLEREERALYIPDRITKKQLKETYTNRQELRRKLKELQRFGERGAEQVLETKGGVIISQYELKNLKEERRRVLYNLKRDLTKLGVQKIKVAGVEQDVTFKESGDENYLNKLERYKLLQRDISKMSGDQLKRYTTLLERTKQYKEYRDSRFYDNYLQGLYEVGRFYGVDDNTLKAIREKFHSFDADTFLTIYDTDKAVQEIMHYYKLMYRYSKMDAKSKIYKDNYNTDKTEVTKLFGVLFENLDKIGV